MAAPSTTAERTGARVERESQTERIWNDVDGIVRLRTGQAADALRKRSETPTPQSARDVAFLMQRHALGRIDVDSMSTGQVTANRAALLVLSMGNARRSSRALNNKSGNDDDKVIVREFNNHLAATFEFMPPAMIGSFPEQLLRRVDGNEIPHENRTHFNRLLRGIEREVATLRALHSPELPDDAEEWQFTLSSVEDDKFGVDLWAVHPDGRRLGFDVKAGGNFNKRVEELLSTHPPRITQQQAEVALTEGYIYNAITDEHGRPTGDITCIFDADVFGPVNNLEFEDPVPVFEFVAERFDDRQSQTLRNMGKTAIVS